ncbi:MAG TPA: UDP-N-acetylmuramoyl-L-alanyl-D-glutamate--2,6-diaminopimelate ligase, partial [Clostridiales bacterium]|nr:UDP-N-acetylmuramoyl-L-alanyl-D-glutamate--2,6-diaminopimelate ligase [Clostridiales bacterium]
LSLIGVTGTNGKTTTTHLIRSVLERCGMPCGLIGTNLICYGNTVLESKSTTPDAIVFQSLLADMVKAGCEYVAMEVSSHALALGRVHGMRFAAAAFTNLTQDHLDFHKTMEAYAETKASLFAMSDVAVINVDDEAAPLMLRAASGRKITYSTKKNEATLIAKSIRLLPDAVEFVALDESGLERMRLGIPGEFSVYNALTVIGICRGLGLSLSDISAALVESKGIAGRAEIVAVDRDYTVMIDYAHTPDALENILRMVRGVAKGRVITVFGCGGDRDKAKRPLMGKIAETLSDVCIVTSDNPRREEPMAIINDILSGMAGKNHIAMENRREAIAAALDMANPGDFILLAGKGHETYQEINGQKHHLDEREVIHAHLSGN